MMNEGGCAGMCEDVELSVCVFSVSVQPTSPKFGKVDSYEKLEKLGEGSYATVYKGKSK